MMVYVHVVSNGSENQWPKASGCGASFVGALPISVLSVAITAAMVAMVKLMVNSAPRALTRMTTNRGCLTRTKPPVEMNAKG